MLVPTKTVMVSAPAKPIVLPVLIAANASIATVAAPVAFVQVLPKKRRQHPNPKNQKAANAKPLPKKAHVAVVMHVVAVIAGNTVANNYCLRYYTFAQ